MTNTNFVQTEVTEIYDLSTQHGTETVFQVNTPSYIMALRHMVGHMLQFQKIKYTGCQIMLQPAARLPADPLQVSYEAGEPTIDPRDLTNPILHRPYHGEADAFDIKTLVGAETTSGASDNTDSISGGLAGYEENTSIGIDKPSGLGSDASGFQAYYLALMDHAWKKSGIMSPLRVNGIPLVRTLATTRQIGPMYPFNITSPMEGIHPAVPQGNDMIGGFYQALKEGAVTDGIPTPDHSQLRGDFNVAGRAADLKVGIDKRGFRQSTSIEGFTGGDSDFNDPSGIFTHKFEKLGWRDTVSQSFRGFGQLDSNDVASLSSESMDAYMRNVLVSGVPRVPMYRIWMPPSYKTEFYFRMYIRHFFEFKMHHSAYGPLAPILNTTMFNLATNRPAEDSASVSVATGAGKVVKAAEGTL